MSPLIVALAFISTADQVYEFSGVARTADGAVFYQETHTVEHRSGVPLRAATRYVDAEGRLLATLLTDFSHDRFAPSYVMRDATGKTIRRAYLEKGALTLEANGKRTKLTMPERASRRLVMGQGLDQYVRYHRAQLANGQGLSVRFPIPTRHDLYGFRVTAMTPPRPGVVRAKIAIDSWIVALIAPSIEADYDAESGRLLRYHGVSNLVDEQGENPKVEIVYNYPEGAR